MHVFFLHSTGATKAMVASDFHAKRESEKILDYTFCLCPIQFAHLDISCISISMHFSMWKPVWRAVVVNQGENQKLPRKYVE